MGQVRLLMIQASKQAPPPTFCEILATFCEILRYAQDSGKLQSSSTLRIGPWKNFQNENGRRLEKDWEPLL